ncbi:tRNA (adenosine(37)-N6)-threonylcarbamoyltransferase complex ATPase subunit type 1 TsaE [Ichthyobacterium seriolicida]|uniref:tRNA threonylcarbamoyladenosine biosynthesis protein TsaE n=1 Tax=Ichthyobacterium seriolicida TaxID=242600 RepID=A0A1J1E0V8_9FLAO|nr:tRNA (adenosine(37)-N6)-threonylcarbamoyltransferase complex ATPase subunit type 1 TsaE [Ichthyobacterium seriolicida]BAV94573.1 ATPase YjeE [Ichthyobacterium seriolicida]
MEYIAKNKEDLFAIAKDIITRKTSKIFCLNGEMGVGKTTLIKEILKVLGVEDNTSSPSFSIINEYLSALDSSPIYHLDFYRLNDKFEIYDTGCEEYFYSGYYCFIEWSDKFADIIPEGAVRINMKLSGYNRIIQCNY